MSTQQCCTEKKNICNINIVGGKESLRRPLRLSQYCGPNLHQTVPKLVCLGGNVCLLDPRTPTSFSFFFLQTKKCICLGCDITESSYTHVFPVRPLGPGHRGGSVYSVVALCSCPSTRRRGRTDNTNIPREEETEIGSSETTASIEPITSCSTGCKSSGSNIQTIILFLLVVF